MEKKTRVRVGAKRNAAGQGRPRKDAFKQFANEAMTEVPPIPERLQQDPVACETWQRQASTLVQRHVLKPSHIPALTAYCNAYAIAIDTIDGLIERGLVGKTFDKDTGEETLKPAPHVVLGKYSEIFIRLGSLLGLDPRSELQSSIASETEKKNNVTPSNPFAIMDDFKIVS